jgi:hypothetical protein
MTREDEAAIVAAWRAYTAGHPVEKDTYLEFLDARVATNARWRRVSVFEILDLLTNLPESGQRRSA